MVKQKWLKEMYDLLRKLNVHSELLNELFVFIQPARCAQIHLN